MKWIDYRVVRDSFNGFECQIWRFWWPFWVEMSEGGRGINTFSSLEKAQEFIEKRKVGIRKKRPSNVVWKERK